VHDHHPKIFFFALFGRKTRINKPRREENNKRMRAMRAKGKDSRIAEMTKSEI
jgi:hypothetical protein